MPYVMTIIYVLKEIKLKKIYLVGITFLFLTSCATTTNKGVAGVERKQFMMLSEQQVESMSLKSYMQTLKEADTKNVLNTDPELVARIRNISNKLIAQTHIYRADAKSWKWEVNVEKNDQVNAYCMPGGKIMVFTGLVTKLNATDGELAAVIGHEISHALREHGRERMSLATAQQTGFALLAILAGTSKNASAANAGVQAAAMGTQLFFALPNSRTQETEADRMGLELASRAGYNPNEAVSLWTKMSKAGGSKPPAWLSSHPSDQARIADIQAMLPAMMPLYEATKTQEN